MADLFRFFSSRVGHYDEEIAAYRRLAERGFRPDAIVDVGAYEGNWTRRAREIFGDVATVMVEPQSAKHDGLRKLCDQLPRTDLAGYVLAAEAGREVIFYEMETGSSLMPERSDVPRVERRHTTQTLDAIAPVGSNLFVKIDAQGAELEILAGGEQTLERAALVQLEVAVADYNEGAPTMAEVLRFMDERGFAVIDVAGHTRLQGHLVQLDLLFVPRSSKLRKDYFEFSRETASV